MQLRTETFVRIFNGTVTLWLALGCGMLAAAQNQPSGPGGFGPVGLVRGQTARLSVQAVAPNTCNGQAVFIDANGNTLKTANLSLQPGQSTSLSWAGTGPSLTLSQGQTSFFELNGNTLGQQGSGPIQRVQVRPVLTQTSGAGTCSASTEVYEQITGRTLVNLNEVSTQ